MNYYNYTDGTQTYHRKAIDVLQSDSQLKSDGVNTARMSSRPGVVIKSIDTNLVSLKWIKFRKTIRGWSNYPRDIESHPIVIHAGVVESSRVNSEIELIEFVLKKHKYITHFLIEFDDKVKTVAFSVNEVKAKIENMYK